MFAPTLQIHRPPTEAEAPIGGLGAMAPGQVRRSTRWWAGLAVGVAVILAFSAGRVNWPSQVTPVNADTESVTGPTTTVAAVSASAVTGGASLPTRGQGASAVRQTSTSGSARPESPATVRPQPAATGEALPASDPAERPRPSVASSPKEACGNRVFIAQAICMKRQCAKPRFTQHPQCVKLREQEAAHRRGMDGGF